MGQLFAALHGPTHAILRGAQLHRIGGKRLGDRHRRLILFARPVVGANRERAAMRLRHVLIDFLLLRLIVLFVFTRLAVICVAVFILKV